MIITCQGWEERTLLFMYTAVASGAFRVEPLLVLLHSLVHMFKYILPLLGWRLLVWCGNLDVVGRRLRQSVKNVQEVA